MLTNIQQYFRYYLALMLSLLLAVGVRLQAAPLGTSTPVDASATAAAGTALRAGHPGTTVGRR